MIKKIKKKGILILIIVFGFHLSIIGQSKNKIALEQIEELKNGVLLVRLQEQNKKLQYLTENSRTDEVEDIEETNNYINRSLIKAFTEYFEFCDVYFFYSDNSKEIKNREYSLLFDSNNNNKVENLDNQNIFFSAYAYRDYGESHLTDRKAIVIMDNNIKQLKEPFPYYSYFKQNQIESKYSIYMYLKELNHFERQVYFLNFNLNKYYEKTARKREKLKYKKKKN